jgi:hypothetical protein
LKLSRYSEELEIKSPRLAAGVVLGSDVMAHRFFSGLRRSPWLLGGLLLVGGCGTEPRILNPTVERNPIVFESPLAAEVFEEELDDRYDSGEADIEPLRGRLSRNAFFNQEVKKADTDNDGILTDVEVTRYAKGD